LEKRWRDAFKASKLNPVTGAPMRSAWHRVDMLPLPLSFPISLHGADAQKSV
jgi:hypothetical protein